jgi:hypothetical protein
MWKICRVRIETTDTNSLYIISASVALGAGD